MKSRKSQNLARLGLLTFWSVSALAGDEASSVFEDADDYTVRIRTSIEYGLGDDQIGASSGTGFVVDTKRGWIVTNRHVVGESPSYVEVSPKDQEFRQAQKVYVDPYVDIAVIATDSATLKQQARLGCDQPPLKKGHAVGAYGHPWGFKYTGTQGVISGLTHLFGPEMLQTDAPINPGNSGGPLISLSTGHVVGVNAAKISKAGVESLGFAVPIDEVCRILALLEVGKDPSPPDMSATFFDLEESDAIVVAQAFASAVALGLQPNDEIVAAGPGLRPVDGYYDLIRRLRGTLDDVQLRVKRDDKLVDLRGTLPARSIRQGVAFAGLIFAPFDSQDVASIPLRHDIGIQNIVEGSRGSTADIAFWDLIHRVNGVEVLHLAHLYVLLSELDEGSTVTLDLLRPLDDIYFFGPIRRTVIAETPVWLSNAGEQAGIGIRVMWAEISALMDDETAEVMEHRLRRLLEDIRDPDVEILPVLRAEYENDIRRLLESFGDTPSTLAAE